MIYGFIILYSFILWVGIKLYVTLVLQCIVLYYNKKLWISGTEDLENEWRKHFTVEELAERYEISPSALKKYFELVFGMPISYYLREKRMEKAKNLLVESRMNIGEISTICGYENQGKFGAAFKTYSGVSPLEYRRLHKNENRE